jgi:hypothetical protein
MSTVRVDALHAPPAFAALHAQMSMPLHPAGIGTHSEVPDGVPPGTPQQVHVLRQ